MPTNETEMDEQALPDLRSSGGRPRVFIVHGHDEVLLQQAARLVQALGLRPVILHEQAGGGMPLIEKLKKHSDVEFAIVLLTADDEGRSRLSTDPHQPRARQNVIFELGFFIGLPAIKTVLALRSEGVEVP